MKQKLEELVNQAMNCMGVAVTIIDLDGRLLFYNQHAARILDRKPEYIGKEIFEFHKKDSSNVKIRTILHEFKHGRQAPFRYQAKPYGKKVHVTVSPIIIEGVCTGCVQSVISENEICFD